MSSSRQGVRFGIIGCGGIAEIHAGAISSLESASLKACFDIDPKRATAFGAKWSCKAFHSLDRMLDATVVDAVIVATPSGAHLEPTIRAANRGLHVLVEKPLEVSVERCGGMIECCQRNDVLLGTVFPSRFRDSYLALKSSVELGSLGKVPLVVANVPWYRSTDYYRAASWRGSAKLDGGGCLMNQGIHYVDMLNWIFGLPSEVSLKSSKVEHRQIECEDTASLMMRFSGDTIATLNISTCIPPGFPRTIDVWGTSQSFLCNDNVLVPRTEVPKTVTPEKLVLPSTHADPLAMDHRFHARVIADFATAIVDRRPPAISGRDGKDAVAVVQSAYQSAAEGRWVSVSSIL